jgi:hypothetical protein
MQRERDKTAKAQAKEQKRQEQKDAKLGVLPEPPEDASEEASEGRR